MSAESNSVADTAIDCGEEFKLEMENSITKYFSNCHLMEEESKNNEQTNKLVREETLINKDIEYLHKTSSIQEISDYIIYQNFSTDKLVPYSMDSLKREKKLSKTISCNSDITLNNENEIKSQIERTDSKETVNSETSEEHQAKYKKECFEIINTLDNVCDETEKKKEQGKNKNDNEAISKSFAIEFIDLLDINMKELKNKKDDFKIIGLEKISEEEEESSSSENIIPKELSREISEELQEDMEKKEELKDKTAKRSKHISFFPMNKNSIKISDLYRSKSCRSENQKNKNINEVDEECKIKKSKSTRSRISRFFKIFKHY